MYRHLDQRKGGECFGVREILEILTGILAVFGVYALFCRLACWATPKKEYRMAVRGDGKTPEEILLLAKAAALYAERDKALSPAMTALLEEEDGAVVRTLSEMQVSVYVRKK